MAGKDFQRASDKDLVEEAQLGLRGQGAVVEMMSRLRKDIDNLDKTTAVYSKIIIVLTIVMLILALIQVIVTIRSGKLW